MNSWKLAERDKSTELIQLFLTDGLMREEISSKEIAMLSSSIAILSTELLELDTRKRRKKRWICLKLKIILNKFSSKIDYIEKWKNRLWKIKKKKLEELRNKRRKKGRNRNMKLRDSWENHQFPPNQLKEVLSASVSDALTEKPFSETSAQIKILIWCSNGLS